MFIKENIFRQQSSKYQPTRLQKTKNPRTKVGAEAPCPNPKSGLENIVFGAIVAASGLQTHGQCYARFVWQCNVQQKR